MKTGIRLLTAALCGAVLFSLCGCGDTTWAMKQGEDAVTSGMYLGYLLQGYEEASSGMTEKADNFWDSTYEEKNVADWVKDYAVKYAKEDLAIREKVREYGIEWGETDDSTLDQMMSYYWQSYQELYEKNGVNEQSFREILRASSLNDKLFRYYYGEGGVEPVSHDELFGYLDSEYLKYKMVELSTAGDGESEPTEEDKAAVREKAEGYLARLQAGEEIDTIINEYAKEQDPEAEETTSEENQYYASAANRESDALTEQLFANAQVGVPTILETDESICVVLRQAMDDTDYDTYHDTILQNYKADAFDEVLTGWCDGMNITVNDAAINRYQPKKLKLEDETASN